MPVTLERHKNEDEDPIAQPSFRCFAFPEIPHFSLYTYYIYLSIYFYIYVCMENANRHLGVG